MLHAAKPEQCTVARDAERDAQRSSPKLQVNKEKGCHPPTKNAAKCNCLLGLRITSAEATGDVVHQSLTELI